MLLSREEFSIEREELACAHILEPVDPLLEGHFWGQTRSHVT